MDKETPKPKKRKSVEKNIPDLTDLTPENQEYINSLIKTATENYKREVSRTVQEYNTDINNLESIISEYLDEFIILGYTPNGRRTLIRYAPTARGYDSIRDLSRQFMMHLLHNGDIPESL